MAKVYESDAFVEYMANQAKDAEDYFGLSEENAEPADSKYASLDALRDIAVNLGTDKEALQTCIDESRYTDAVNEMMNQGNQLFGVSGTPGNVIVDREN
jgi:protein-disulfide isomerase